ncbi:MAG TPA: hypothetical protein VF731_10215 [Solirubrobacterales bacterium]
MHPWVPDTHGWTYRPRSDAEWLDISAAYGAGPGSPLARVLGVAREGGCRTVVVENRYIDVDYRSEYSAFWSLKFDARSPFCHRLHFFTAELDDDALFRLPKAPGYLGYSVVRPVEYGRVGRTVLAPPPHLGSATLTEVNDAVTLFGNLLKVRGVPFCEQDSEFLRCAQAAAWICHYTAARHGQVGRRSTAQIVELSPTMLSPERALPSQGMTLNQLQAVFGSLNQPAMFYGLSNMPRVPGVPDSSPPAEHPNAPPGLWDKRMLSVICRYLNSGFPVLIGAQDHAFVLVGWFRDEDGRTVFVACDDQVGPYEVIADPFAHYKAPWDSIMIPLPPRVFLSGESAEGKAHSVFRSVFEQTEELGDMAERLMAEEIVLRTVLLEGAELKRRVETLTSSEEVLRLIRYARLPHWVWVVEAHDKSLCATGPCVVATAIFDGTSYDRSPPVDILSVPGLVAVYPPDQGAVSTGDGSAEASGSLLSVH